MMLGWSRVDALIKKDTKVFCMHRKRSVYLVRRSRTVSVFLDGNYQAVNILFILVHCFFFFNSTRLTFIYNENTLIETIV